LCQEHLSVLAFFDIHKEIPVNIDEVINIISRALSRNDTGRRLDQIHTNYFHYYTIHIFQHFKLTTRLPAYLCIRSILFIITIMYQVAKVGHFSIT